VRWLELVQAIIKSVKELKHKTKEDKKLFDQYSPLDSSKPASRQEGGDK
jgi:hypothetical protein